MTQNVARGRSGPVYPATMVGKIILAIIIAIILYCAWRIWHACSTGRADSLIGKVFAWPCHLVFAS